MDISRTCLYVYILEIIMGTSHELPTSEVGVIIDKWPRNRLRALSRHKGTCLGCVRSDGANFDELACATRKVHGAIQVRESCKRRLSVRAAESSMNLPVMVINPRPHRSARRLPRPLPLPARIPHVRGAFTRLYSCRELTATHFSSLIARRKDA